MSLETRLAAFISAVGADIKALQQASPGGGTPAANVPDPEDFGFKAWTFDHATVVNNTVVPTAGVMHCIRMRNETGAAMTISSMSLYVVTAGASLTNVGARIYDYASAGTGLSSASVNANGATAAAFQATGLKTITFTTPATIPSGGRFYASFWFTGTTMPALLRGSSSGPVNNIGTASPLWRYMTANTGLTNAAPGTIGTTTQGSNAWWAAAA